MIICTRIDVRRVENRESQHIPSGTNTTPQMLDRRSRGRGEYVHTIHLPKVQTSPDQEAHRALSVHPLGFLGLDQHSEKGGNEMG